MEQTQIIYEGLAFFILFMALMISTAPTVLQMIPYYQAQSVALALITFITAFEYHDAIPYERFIVFLFTIIPLFLLFSVKPLLALATIPEDVPVFTRLFNAFLRNQTIRNAYPIWLAQRANKRSPVWFMLIDMLLIILAFFVAFSLVNDQFIASILAISFSLLLLGLSIMRSKTDIISQIMGLLVMEHGMFLAAIRLLDTSVVVVAFVISLLLYILITLTILMWLLPDLHRASGTIEIDQQKQLKG